MKQTHPRKKWRHHFSLRLKIGAGVLVLLIGAVVYLQFPQLAQYLKGQTLMPFSGGLFVAMGDVTGDSLPDLITAPDRGGGPHIKVFSGTGSSPVRSFMAYSEAFTGGVRVASADINRDGAADIVTAPGPGGGPHVKIFNGITSAELRGFFAYDAAFTGGVYVAAGDFNGDGVPDVVTAPGAGGGPHVKVFDGATLAMLRSFMAYSEAFTGGVRVASADINRDGTADIITAPGPGGGPHLKIFNGRTGSLIREWQAYDSRFSGGVFVATGDVTGDGTPDIITAPDAGGGPHVKVFDGVTGGEVRGFFAFSANITSGVRLASGDVTGDGKADVAVAVGPGTAGIVSHLNGQNGQTLTTLHPYLVPAPPPIAPSIVPPPVCVGEGCGPRPSTIPCFGEGCSVPPHLRPSPLTPAQQAQQDEIYCRSICPTFQESRCVGNYSTISCILSPSNQSFIIPIDPGPCIRSCVQERAFRRANGMPLTVVVPPRPSPPLGCYLDPGANYLVRCPTPPPNCIRNIDGIIVCGGGIPANCHLPVGHPFRSPLCG